MNRSDDTAGSQWLDLERHTISSLRRVLEQGANGGPQTVLYMLAVGEVEDIEARARQGERILGLEALLLSTARTVMA